MKLIFLAFVVCVSFCITAESYKILYVCPPPAYSHFTLCFRLAKELADKGHEVHFINNYPQRTAIKNLKDISLKEIIEPLSEYLSELTDFGQMSFLRQMEFVSQYGKRQVELVFQHENIKNLTESKETFDVVVLHHFFNEALAFFAHRFKCPLVMVAPWSASLLDNHIFGNPAPISYVANFLAHYGNDMSFFERIMNTYTEIFGELFVKYRMNPLQNKVLHKEHPDSPELSTILYNASLLLATSHVSLNEPLPLQPSIKEIGGYHILPPKPLPRKIQEFMDNATEGVVVFSMGSNLKSANFQPETRRAILNAFSKIKQKVLWKFEADLPEKPPNVKILGWLPQSDILAHPNTELFISHGGLLGTTEAIHHGVPILGLPVFWDQARNIGFVVRKGLGLKVNFYKLNEENFNAALQEMLNNPKYRNNAKVRSSITRDRPLKALDEGVFWIEYVIRHKGAPHLRSAALKLYWYQIYLLDVFLFILMAITIICTILYFILKCLFRKSRLVEEDKKNQ